MTYTRPLAATLLTSVTPDNVADVRIALAEINRHLAAVRDAAPDARPQHIAAHRAHVTMFMQSLRRAHADLATIAPAPRHVQNNLTDAVLALTDACERVSPDAAAAAALAAADAAAALAADVDARLAAADAPTEPAPDAPRARRARRS